MLARDVRKEWWHKVLGGGGEKKGVGEDVMTYLGGILLPDCWLWPLRSVHVEED